MNRKPNARAIILDATIETLKTSSLHGIQNIIKNPFKLIKIIWLICLLCSASYFFYAMFRSITRYLDYPVDTRIKVDYVNGVAFPLVKLCRYDFNVPSSTSGGSPTSDKMTYTSAIIYFRNLYKSRAETFKRTVGIKNLSDVMISCIYNFRYCNATEFSYYYDFRFGSCWQFNSGKDSSGQLIPFKISRGAGLTSGLFLELYLGESIDNKNYFSTINAFELLITNETIDGTSKEGIKIVAGMSTHITVEKYLIKTQPKPYSNCVENLVSEDAYPSECYKKTLQQAIRQERLYHYSDCSFMCLQKLLADTCGCQYEVTDPYYPSMKRRCLELSDIPCVRQKYAEFLNNRSHMDMCDCPRECTEAGYSVLKTLTNYPTRYRAGFLTTKSLIVQNKFTNSSELTYSDLNNRIASVYIYYNELKEMMISQKPKMLLFDLIAQIGSQMGVFLGLSFLSFVEIFEILLQAVILLFKSKLTKD